MQATKLNQLFIILLFLCSTCFSNKEKTVQNFTICKNDSIYVNMDNFLPYGNFLNDLQIQQSPQLNIQVPQKYEKKVIHDDMDYDIFDNIKDIATYSNFIAFLHQNSEQENYIFLEQIDINNNKNESENILFAPQSHLCSQIEMDSEFIFTSCFSTTEFNLQLCQLQYSLSQISVPSCFGIVLDIVISDNILFDGTLVRMDYYMNKEYQKRFFAIYFENSDYKELHNSFYLYDEISNSKITLEDNIIINKIKTVSYNSVTQEAVILILVTLSDQSTQLRYYQIKEMLLESQHDYKLVKNDINNFFFEFDTLIMTLQTEDDIIIYDVDLEDLSYDEFTLRGVKKLRKIEIKNNYVLFDIYDTTYQVDIYLLDLTNRRFFKIDDLERKELNKQILKKTFYDSDQQFNQRFQMVRNSDLLTSLGDFGHQTYLFEFMKGLVTVFELKNFKYVVVDLKDHQLQNQQGLLKFQFQQQEYKINFQFEDFNYLKKINEKPYQIKTVWNKEYQFHLKVYGNDMKFESNSTIDYVNEIIREQDNIDCTPIQILYSPSKMIKLCTENYILIYKQIKYEESSNLFSYKKISQIQMPDKISLKDVQKANFLYSKFLIFMTNDMNIYYFNLTKEKFSLNKNEIANQFQSCLFDNNYIICKDFDQTFDMIRILFFENKLIFEYVKNIKATNAELESFFIPQYNDDTVVYITKDEYDDNYYLEKFENGNYIKMFNRFNLKDITMYEIFHNEYLCIENLEENKVQIFALINESQIFYPPQIVKQIDRIIQVKIFQEFKLFFIIYYSKKNETRLLIGKSSLNVYNRVIRDLLIDPSLKLGSMLSIQKLLDHKLLISIFDLLDFNFEKHFTYNVLGPIYHMSSSNKKTMIKYTINSQKINFTVEHINFPITPISFSQLQIQDYDEDEKIMEFKLDKSIIKNYNQGIIELTQMNKKQLKDRVLFENRINFDFKKTIKKFDDYSAKEWNQIYDFKANKDSFSIFIKDFLYLEEQGFYNNMYKNCNFIKTNVINEIFEELYICQNIKTFELDLTNFKEINIPLKIQKEKFYSPQLLQFENQIYFAFKNKGHQSILLWKFKFDEEEFTFDQEFLKIINSNDFLLNQNVINNFQMYKPIDQPTIYFFIINKLSSKINIKKFNVDNNIFSSKNQREILFQNDQIIENVDFFYEGERLISFMKSNQKIYEIEFHQKEDQLQWQLETINEYIYLEPEIFGEKIQYTFSENYFGLVNQSASLHKVMLYMRRPKYDEYQNIIPQQVFESLQEPSKVKFKNIAIIDKPLQIEQKSQTVFNKYQKKLEAQSYLYLISFEDQNLNSSDSFKEVSLTKYTLGEMNVKIDLSQFEHQSTLKFKVTYPNGEMGQIQLVIKDKRSMIIMILTIVLCILSSILIVLIFVNFSVYQKNLQLKKQREQDNDASSFMDRTAMQI